MNITKTKNETERNCFDFTFTDKNKKLDIFYAGNLDLYLSITDNKIHEMDEKYCIPFDITKENYEIFSIFDKMYNNIISGKIFEEREYEDLSNYKDSCQYRKLVDDKKRITWVSDDDYFEHGDRFIMEKVDDDTYRFNFIRDPEAESDIFKSGLFISVRLRNSGSRYNYFNCAFMEMYQKLQYVNTECHQIHYEEILYEEKKLKKVLKRNQ